MLFRMIYDEDLAQAAYLIGCQKTGEAIIIDPERDVDRYIDEAARHGLRITAVAETHIHADFLSGARELAERSDAMLYLSDEGDAYWKYQWLKADAGGRQYPHQLLRDGDTFNVGKIELRAVHTPGHTPEHLSYVVTDRGGGASEPIGVATGDFLFVGDVGRPDLLESAAGFENVKEASARQLAQSSKQIANMPDFVQVWPAHGAGSACGKALGAVPQSTIGYEKRFNPALKLSGDEAEFVDYVLAGQPEPPLYFGRMKSENRDGPKVLGDLPNPPMLTGEALAALDGRKVVILDTRDWATFRDGHVRGALFAPIGSAFPVVAGSYVRPTDEIVLVVSESDRDRAIRNLVRIGLDQIIGLATPQMISGMDETRLARSAETSVGHARSLIDSGACAVLDVRGAAERETGSISGSIHIAHTRLAEALHVLPQDRSILVHCRSGARSAMASAYLERNGYHVINLAGGFNAWQNAEHSSAATVSEAPPTCCPIPETNSMQ